MLPESDGLAQVVPTPERNSQRRAAEQIPSPGGAAIDSAAVDNVMPSRMLGHIPRRPSARSKAGRHYVAANDQEIRNLGERKVQFQTDDGLTKSIMFQDAEVGRCLISADKLK